MRAGSSPYTIDEAGSASDIAVISALAFEHASLDARIDALNQSPIHVYQCGPGQDRAYDATRTALAAGATAIVSWGVAGGLQRGLRSGTIVVPRRVRAQSGAVFDTDSRWRMQLCRSLKTRFPVDEGDLYQSPDVLKTATEKAAIATTTGAVAVDMESAAIARASADARRPFVAVRVVVDTSEDSLPAGVEAWIDEAGNRKPGAAWAVLVNPRDWPSLVNLFRRYRAARRSLAAASALLVPHGLVFDDAAMAGD